MTLQSEEDSFLKCDNCKVKYGRIPMTFRETIKMNVVSVKIILNCKLPSHIDVQLWSWDNFKVADDRGLAN